MRTQILEQPYLNFCPPSSGKVVRAYREKYEAIGRLLEANARVVALAHRDFAKYLSSSPRGRRGQYTSGQILRALVVMFVEQVSFRAAVIRIDTSEFLRDFVGLGLQPTMDFSFLSKAHSALSPGTWQAMHAVLNRYALREKKIGGERLRLDSTVYESNIHYPTDSSLLWDGFRTLARVLKALQQELPRLGLKHRFHVDKVKKLAFFIARSAGSPSGSKKRRVRSAYRKLIERVRWIASVGREALARAERAGYEVEELAGFLPTVERIVDQAQRRVLEGVAVPCEEKVYSLFEAHTELLQRGKAGKPVEFGHKVLIAQTGEKFIHHYEVLSRRREDIELLEPALEAHRRLFETNPEVVATDKGFYQSMKQMARLERDIATVSICKKGRRNERETERESTEAFREGQRFRAGVEGSISVLKRAFKLGRCFFKGFKNYASSVGCAIFCHNLVLLARL